MIQEVLDAIRSRDLTVDEICAVTGYDRRQVLSVLTAAAEQPKLYPGVHIATTSDKGMKWSSNPEKRTQPEGWQ